MNPGGVIYLGPSRLDPTSEIVVILTGPSANRKTGPLWQTWILRTDRPPLEAREDGSDQAICGSCVFRATGDRPSSCYVVVAQAPGTVYRAWQAGGYRRLDLGPGSRSPLPWYRGDGVRLGAYGDPAAVPMYVWRRLLAGVDHWTGYTHAWRGADPQLQGICMASVESLADASEARAAGWRTFRVRMGEGGAALQRGEVVCPASTEAGYKTTCDRCRLCTGGTLKAGKPLIAILPHGPLRGLAHG